MDIKLFKETLFLPTKKRFDELTEKVNKAFQNYGNEEYKKELAKLGRTEEDESSVKVSISKPVTAKKQKKAKK